MRLGRHAALPLLSLSAALLLLGACTRGPDEATLRQEVQENLAHQVKPGLFEIAVLKRRGSAPLPAADDGAKRLVVYFNATLRFAQGYDFSSWEKLSPASLAYALGATEKGLIGLKSRNSPGDRVYVYGSSTYEWSGSGWKGVASAPSGMTPAPALGNTATPSRSKQLIDKLAAMVDLPPPGIDPNEDAVISQELARATENIERRLERREHIFTFASGPHGGQYTRFGSAFVEGVAKSGEKVTFRNRETDGSVENAWLLTRGEADYALIQSDVAARAFAGEPPFAGRQPLSTLRALGSLFPEPVHIVVPASSPIRDIADLRGKRVDIGLPGSGTQYDALAVLDVNGLRAFDFAEARQEGMETAMRRMRDGKLDALFVTIAAPTRDLQAFAARYGVRMLSLSSGHIKRLVARHPGLVAITLPPNTYPGQSDEIRTVAATALLVATTSVPDGEAEDVLDLIFEKVNFASSGSPEGSKVAKQTALRGITIPLHAAARHYFGTIRSQ